eukprot:gnl/MRDRNA2_/MRDRNA2_80078_c0_seq1.p1 gnl/MRDRNA2_/MRDRNA2_80078_c0~~gnl/MRDRNA2_/MRDRNA2_80078_c0_seq1.p1  ORF type:complete len:537 (+),score=83.21 gnl/MRDRNA2_/MRDRNA2_80078_c0_seq1:241-1851(+)
MLRCLGGFKTQTFRIRFLFALAHLAFLWYLVLVPHNQLHSPEAPNNRIPMQLGTMKPETDAVPEIQVASQNVEDPQGDVAHQKVDDPQEDVTSRPVASQKEEEEINLIGSGKAGPRLVKGLINVCYAPDNSDSQLSYMVRSIRSILYFASDTTRKRLVFHIFSANLTRLAAHVASMGWHQNSFPSFRVYNGATQVVTKKRAVWSKFAWKLSVEQNYVRAYIPQLIDKAIEKFMYLDTDTIVVSDISRMYDAALRDGNFTLAAGFQNRTANPCVAMQHQYDMSSKRVKHLDIQKNDPSLTSSIFVADRWRWLRENRTGLIEYWLEENWKKMLWHLGMMPSMILSFQKNWEVLPQELARDWKGHTCCPPKFDGPELLENRSVVLHPFKKVVDPGIFEQFLGKQSFNKADASTEWEKQSNVFILPAEANLLQKCPTKRGFAISTTTNHTHVCLQRKTHTSLAKMEEIGKKACAATYMCRAVTVSKQHSMQRGSIYQAALFRTLEGRVQEKMRCEGVQDKKQTSDAYVTYVRKQQILDYQ